MRTSLTIAAMCLALAGPASAQIAETPEAAAALPDLGRELSPDMVGGTMRLYGPMLASYGDEGLITAKDLSYGPAERNLLDVYAPQGADAAPVLVFVHGGGFVRGDKADVANIGRYMARHGIVGVTMNYRFAPNNAWPSGAEDLGLVLAWIQAEVAAYGGDPAKVFVAGNSAGAMHVADYVFREDLQHDGDGVIGAVLISTPTVDLTAREVDPQRDALYYGTEGDRAEQSVINHLEGREIPVMVAYAENEPDVIIDQTRILIEGLTARDGRMPLTYGAPGHNHISIVAHIGTADESLAREIVDFVTWQAMQAE